MQTLLSAPVGTPATRAASTNRVFDGCPTAVSIEHLYDGGFSTAAIKFVLNGCAWAALKDQLFDGMVADKSVPAERVTNASGPTNPVPTEYLADGVGDNRTMAEETRADRV